jgi:hypothetical protein
MSTSSSSSSSDELSLSRGDPSGANLLVGDRGDFGDRWPDRDAGDEPGDDCGDPGDPGSESEPRRRLENGPRRLPPAEEGADLMLGWSCRPPASPPGEFGVCGSTFSTSVRF